MPPIHYRSLRRKAKGIVNAREMAEARRRSSERWMCNHIQRLLSDPLFRVAYHEVGHFLVRLKLERLGRFSITLEKNEAGDWVGKTSRVSEPEGNDDPDHVGQISIAGAVAESFSADEAYTLLTEHPYLKESDYKSFQWSQGVQRAKLEAKLIFHEREYFDLQYRKVRRTLTRDLRFEMERIAHQTISDHGLSLSYP